MKPPARIVAFIGPKGGIGKTMTAVSVAAELHARGHKAMLLDAEPRIMGSARSWANKPGADLGGLRVVHELMRFKSLNDYKRQRASLKNFATGQDVLIVDAPGEEGDAFHALMLIADLVVLPCGPAEEETEVLESVLNQDVPKVRRHRKDLAVAILATRTEGKRTKLSKELRVVLNDCDWPVFKTSIPRAADFRNARAAGSFINAFASGGDGALAIRSLATEFEEVLGLRAVMRSRREPSRRVETSKPSMEAQHVA